MAIRSPSASVLLMVSLAFAPSPAGGGEMWKAAEGERTWSFPRDHGAHRDYRTEWWYFTGQVQTPAGRSFGYQLTFFRFGAAMAPRPEGNPWAVRDMYAAHFSLTDAGSRTFHFAERLSREGPGLAGSGNGEMDVVLLDWSVRTDDGEIVLHAREGGMALDLRLKTEETPLLHGFGGRSPKGSGRGQASWYYSLTDLSARGTIRAPGTEETLPVEGWTWFDHEFGSNQLAQDQAGWDWFALRLSDGRRVMLYLLRRRDGTLEPSSSGTLRTADGEATHLARGDFTIKAASTWRSPASGAVYPSGWQVDIPAAGIDVTLSPLLQDQELVTSRSTGITYWEGAVAGGGRSGEAEVTVEGYVELTGYGGALGGLF